VSLVSSASDPDDIVTYAGLAAVAAPRPRDRRDPWLRIELQAIAASPLAGQPGHGSKAVLRRQPVRIVDGRFEGGYTDGYEVICPDCGDDLYLDYSEVSWRLQWLRGPYTLEAGLAAYHIHLQLAWPARPELKFPVPARRSGAGS
jgi:hypothetical protein